MKDNINLKIYWVTTIWPKWQVIIPKDGRNDLNISIWTQFWIALIDKKAFWIWSVPDLKSEVNRDTWWLWNVQELWQIKIWTKFQFVIPNQIRKELNMLSWDTLIVLWKSNKWIWFIKNDNIEYLLDFIKTNVL